MPQPLGETQDSKTNRGGPDYRGERRKTTNKGLWRRSGLGKEFIRPEQQRQGKGSQMGKWEGRLFILFKEEPDYLEEKNVKEKIDDD